MRKAQQDRVEQLLDEDRNAHGNSGRSARIRAGDSSKARSGAGYSSGGAHVKPKPACKQVRCLLHGTFTFRGGPPAAAAL